MNFDYNHQENLPKIEKYRKVFIAAITAAALMGPGMGFGKLYLFHVVLFFTLGFSAYYVQSQGKWTKMRVMIIPALLFLFMASSLAWADSFSMGVKQIAIAGFGVALIGCLVALCETKHDLFLILKVTAIVFLVSCIIGLVEMAFGFSWPWSRNSPWLYLLGRDIFLSRTKFTGSDIDLIRHTPTAFFWNPNNFAVFVTCFLPFILFSKRNKWLVFGATALVLIIIIGAGARMCFWVLMLALPFWLIFFRKKIQLPTAALLCVTLFFISLNMFVWKLPVNAFNQFKLPYGEIIFGEPIIHKGGGHSLPAIVEEEENSISFRKEMIERSFVLIKEQPILGAGAAGIEHEFVKNKTKSGLIDLHFYWLELLVNYGILWTIVLIAALGYLIVRLIRKKTTFALSTIFSTALFIPCVISLSTGFYYLPGYLLFACLILCSTIPSSDEITPLR